MNRGIACQGNQDLNSVLPDSKTRCVCVFVCFRTHMCTHRDPRLPSGIFLGYLLPYSLRQCLSTEARAHGVIQLVWLASLGDPLPLTVTLTQHFHECSGSELRSSAPKASVPDRSAVFCSLPYLSGKTGMHSQASSLLLPSNRKHSINNGGSLVRVDLACVRRAGLRSRFYALCVIY